MKIGVLLHGSGVFDGTEIQEAVLSLLAIAEAGHEYQCFAPQVKQSQVINHLNGDEQPQERNVLEESARIARGEITDLAAVSAQDYDALVMPGGFGTAKNITDWAFKGPESAINPGVKELILRTVEAGKPICALCMSPTTLAKALEGSDYHARLTVGTTEERSPYDIQGINAGMEAVGVQPEMKTIREITVDEKLKIVTAPCYMMEAGILEVRRNIQEAIATTLSLVS